jgi:GNAT superfamily N-acetyltransferase
METADPHVIARRGQFIISTDPARLDVAMIHAFLSEQSYWAAGIPIEVVRRSLVGAICFGIYDGERQVGFARVVTDRATFAYLGDVFVVESHRGQGLSKWLMECVLAHPDLQGLRRILLATRDAHGLYHQFGFVPLADPTRFLEIARPDVYRQQEG